MKNNVVENSKYCQNPNFRLHGTCQNYVYFKTSEVKRKRPPPPPNNLELSVELYLSQKQFCHRFFKCPKGHIFQYEITLHTRRGILLGGGVEEGASENATSLQQITSLFTYKE